MRPHSGWLPARFGEMKRVMPALRILYRDPDRAPYLHLLRHMAERRGVDVVLIKAAFSDPYPEQLLEGSVELLAENYWGLQSQAAAGAPLVSIATTVPVLNETLFVAPSIATLDDLRGQRMALRGQGPSELIARLWIEDRGPPGLGAVVLSERDVGRWGHWKAVADGSCQAAFVTDFHRRGPLDAGLKPLAIAPYGFLGNLTLTTRSDVIETREADVAALVAAAFDASRAFRLDRETTLGIMRGEPATLMGIASDADLIETYQILRGELAPMPVPTLDAIRNTHRMRLKANPELTDFNPLLMWDLRFARRAAADQRKAGLA